MANLGEFGAAVRELDENREPDTFTFCGEQFTTVDDIPPVLMYQIGGAIASGADAQEGMGAVWMALRASLGDDQFDKWYRLAMDKHASNEAILGLTLKLYEVQAGRPTGQRSASSAGPPSTSPSSNTSSTHPALAHLRPISEVLTG